MGIKERQIKSLSTLDVFGMGVLVCPIDIFTLATLMKNCWAGKKKQWRCCK